MAWKDLDDKLARGGVDASKVACSEEWELDYVIDTIKEIYDCDEFKAKAVADECCNEVQPPRPRQDFCKCVARKMKEGS